MMMMMIIIIKQFREQKCDKKEAEIIKYKDLTLKIQRMWNVKMK